MKGAKTRQFYIFGFIAIFIVIFFSIFDFNILGIFNQKNNWYTVSATELLNGEGSKENPYIISSEEDLLLIANNINATEDNNYNNKYYKQTQDIEITNQTFIGIGCNSTEAITLYYDGLGHSITQLQNENFSHFSMFGKVENSRIQNLHIKNIEINVNYTDNNVSKNIGIFADFIKDSTISNCSLEMAVLSAQGNNFTNANIGGFVGLAKDSILCDCFCESISLFNQFDCDNLNFGLFVGKAEDCKISTCFANGRLKVYGNMQNANIGSFVGDTNSKIINCYTLLNNGFEIDDITLMQNANIGGFAGVVDNASDILNCYAVTTFINQNYSTKNIGLFVGQLTDDLTEFSNCYFIDKNNAYIDLMGTFIYDASNLLTRNTILAQNYYSLSSYVGFSNLIWKDNYNISKYPELFGVGNILNDEFEIKLTDEFGITKGFYEKFEDCIEHISTNDFIFILKDQISVTSLHFTKSVSIESNVAVEFNIIESNDDYLFALTNGATIIIDGNILFRGLENSYKGFASGQGTETLVLKNTTVSDFICDTLFDGLSVELYGVTIQNNCTQNLINAQYIFVKNSTINQNKDSLNNKSIISIEDEIEIYGYGNLLDISLSFGIENQSIKVQRTGLIEELINKNSNIDITITSNENYWITNTVLIQGNQNLIYDNISYALTNSPKFSQTSTSKFILKQVDQNLCLGGQLFDIEYFDNQTGSYNRYFGKDEFGQDMPNYFEYGVDLSVSSLQNDDLQFVGWFGYNETTDKYFDKYLSAYSTIFNLNLSSSTAINLLNKSYVSQMFFYNQPIQSGSNITAGKFILYSKWRYTVAVEMQEEIKVGDDIHYTTSFDAGVLSIDNSIYTTATSNIVSKQIYVGQGMILTACPNADYAFVGWWQEINGEFVKYNRYQYNYNKQSNLYVLNIETTDCTAKNLYARYIKNAYIINLQEIFKDEHNLQTPVQIFSNAEQILYASIRKNGTEYIGKEYLDIVANELILRNEEKVVLQIDPKNYHLDLLQGKRVKEDAIQNNYFPSFDFNELNYTLTIENNVGSGYGSLTIYLEKNYHTITLEYGDDQNSNNFIGGDCVISETYLDGDKIIYSTFSHNTVQKMTDGVLTTVYKTANIYFGTNTIIYFNTKDGYRFDIAKTSVFDTNGQRVDFDIIKENDIPKAIVINNIIQDIEIFIHFQKTYQIQFSLNKIDIDGVLTYIGELQIESDDWTTEDISKVVDKGSSINFKTQQTISFNAYQFVKWTVTSNGELVDLEKLGLTEEDLTNKELILYNINQDLEFSAFYNKLNVKVSVIWNGKNGRIANIGAKSLGNDSYEIEFNNDIMFVITPKSQKYFIKRLECENLDLQTESVKNDDGSTSFVLKNVLSNTKLYLDIIADSWLEHLQADELWGDGTKDNPYYIRTPSELQLVAKFVNENVEAQEGKIKYIVAYYKLLNDIDLGEDYFFVPIGTASNPFNGTFDYNFYAINNITTEPNSYLIDNSLFYIMGKDGKIINQYHSTKLIIIGLICIAVTIVVAIIVVFIIEKKRKKPKKIIIFNKDITKNVE